MALMQNSFPLKLQYSEYSVFILQNIQNSLINYLKCYCSSPSSEYIYHESKNNIWKIYLIFVFSKYIVCIQSYFIFWYFPSYRLNDCDLTDKSCSALATVLGSDTNLKELNMNNNNLQDSGVNVLCTGLKNIKCKLEILG